MQRSYTVRYRRLGEELPYFLLKFRMYVYINYSTHTADKQLSQWISRDTDPRS
jgi:hypothetical protein